VGFTTAYLEKYLTSTPPPATTALWPWPASEVLSSCRLCASEPGPICEPAFSTKRVRNRGNLGGADELTSSYQASAKAVRKACHARQGRAIQIAVFASGLWRSWWIGQVVTRRIILIDTIKCASTTSKDLMHDCSTWPQRIDDPPTHKTGYHAHIDLCRQRVEALQGVLFISYTVGSYILHIVVILS
jgi:hypothetical protein